MKNVNPAGITVEPQRETAKGHAARCIANARYMLRYPAQKRMSDRRAGLLRQALQMGDCYGVDLNGDPSFAFAITNSREMLAQLLAQLDFNDLVGLVPMVLALTDREFDASRYCTQKQSASEAKRASRKNTAKAVQS